jgi:hypothetical protein
LLRSILKLALLLALTAGSTGCPSRVGGRYGPAYDIDWNKAGTGESVFEYAGEPESRRRLR